MRADYCPVANEPCQAMCLDDCRLQKRSYYVAGLEKERKQLQAMLNQERTETEALLRQALDFCEFTWRDVPMNDYAFERLEQTITAIRQHLGETE